jgi:hypothetical protein
MKIPLKKDDQEFADWGWIRDAEGNMIAVASLPSGTDMEKHRREKTDPTQERVDTIIRAVNCHDELVEALQAQEDAEEWIANADQTDPFFEETYRHKLTCCAALRSKALAKAGKVEG